METESGSAQHQVFDWYSVIKEYIKDATETGKILTLKNFVNDNLTFIVSQTKIGENFQNNWTSRFNTIARELNVTVKRSTPDWSKVCEGLVYRVTSQKTATGISPSHIKVTTSENESRASDSSATSQSEMASSGSGVSSSVPQSSSNSSSSKASLSDKNRQWVKNLYESLRPDQKWWLNTVSANSESEQVEKTAVEDRMKILALKYSHHHPVHSIILNTRDEVWKSYFSYEELHQINTFNSIKLPSIPDSLKEYFLSYQGKKTLDQLLEHRRRHNFDPRTQPDLYWAQKSIIHITDLFLYDELPINNDTEGDFVHQKWCFIQSCFHESQFCAQSGEKSSLSSSIRRNQGRTINEQGQLSRKLVGAKVDLVMKHGNLEYGCMEAGCSSDPFNTKAVNEGRLKLPRTLKDILSRLAKEAPGQVSDIKFVGFIVAGTSLTLYIGDCPAGSVTRIKDVGPYDFPESIEEFSRKFIPLLALVWQAKAIMKTTLPIINGADEIILPSIDGPDPSPIVPCMPSPKTGSKRKLAEADDCS